ncbi:hypothetical protein ACJMK2_041419 [Sinanodonta woodiana]|uniref:XK-related protein n=1 Tax=Sinanodonta woodiana TaxID=1069815 RepID=A0ABD3W715_SINWO
MAEFQKKFTAYDIFTTCLSTISYVADVITDILLIVVFFLNGDQIWGSLTLGFVTASSLMMLIFSFQWHVADKTLTPGNFIAHILFLSPVHRYIRLLRLGLKARHSSDESISEAAFREMNDICILRLFETFLESTPQLVLQLYIILKFQQFGVIIGVSAACSLLSIGWSVTAYNDALRLACRKYYKRNWLGMISQTLCQIGMVASRVLAVVLFSAVFQTWIFLPIGIHWLVMILWIRHQKPDFGSTPCERGLFMIVAATVYIFCFINLKDGRSRWRLLIYYSLVLLESSLFVALWMIYKDVSTPLWYSITAFTVIYGGFFLGAVLMLVYYGCFHPSSPVPASPKACQTVCIIQDKIQDPLKTRACNGTAALDHPNLWLNASHDLSAAPSHSMDAVQVHPDGKCSPGQQCIDDTKEVYLSPVYYMNKNSTMLSEVSSQPESCCSVKRAESSENSSLDQSKSKLQNSITYSIEDRVDFASKEVSPQHYCKQGNPNVEYVTAALTTRSQKQNFSKNKLPYNKTFGVDLSLQNVSHSEFSNDMFSQRNKCNSSSSLSNTILDRTNILNQNNSLFSPASVEPMPRLETSGYSSASRYSVNSLSPLDPYKLWEEMQGRVNSMFYTSPSLSSLQLMGGETNKGMGTSFKNKRGQTVIVQETDLDAYSSKYVILNRANNMDNEYSSNNNLKMTLMMDKPDLIKCTSGNCNSSASSIQGTHMYSDTLSQENNNFISSPSELFMSQYSLSLTVDRKRRSPEDGVDRSRSDPCMESFYQMASCNDGTHSAGSQSSYNHSGNHSQHAHNENQSSTDSGMLPHSSHSTSLQCIADNLYDREEMDVFYKDRILSSTANNTTQSRSEMSSHGQSSDSGMHSPREEQIQRRHKGDILGNLSTMPESCQGPGFSDSYPNITPPYPLPEIGSRTISRLGSDRNGNLLNKASHNFRFFKDPRSPVPADTNAKPWKDSDISPSMDQSNVTNFSNGERGDSSGFYQDKSSLSAYISGLSSDIGMEDTSSSDELFAEQDSKNQKLCLRERSKSLANIQQEPILSQYTIREKFKSGSDLTAETENFKYKIGSSNMTYLPQITDASEHCTDTNLNFMQDPMSDTPWRVDYMNSSLPKQTLSEMYTQLSETSCMKLDDSRYSYDTETIHQTGVQKQVTGRETRKSLFTASSLELTPTKMEHYDLSPHKLGRSVDLFNRSAWRASLDKEQQMRLENSFVGKSVQSKILYDDRGQKTGSPHEPQMSDLAESPYRFRYSNEKEDSKLSQLSGNKSFGVDLSQKCKGGQNENQAQSDTSSTEVEGIKDSLSSLEESYQGDTERGLYSSTSLISDHSDKYSSASNSITSSLLDGSRTRKSPINRTGKNSAFRPVKPRESVMPKSSHSITFSVHKGQSKDHTYINTISPLGPLDSSDKENLAPDAITLSSYEESSSSFRWSKLSSESSMTGTSLEDKSSINYLRMAGHTSLNFSHGCFPQMGNPSFLSNHSQSSSIPWEDSANISNSIHQYNLNEHSQGSTLPVSTSKRQPLKSLENTPGVSPIGDKSLHTSLELSSWKHFMSTPKFSTESEASSHRNLKSLSSGLELHQSRRSSGIGANTPNQESSSWSSQQDFENFNFTELDKNNISSFSTYV